MNYYTWKLLCIYICIYITNPGDTLTARFIKGNCSPVNDMGIGSEPLKFSVKVVFSCDVIVPKPMHPKIGWKKAATPRFIRDNSILITVKIS